MTIRTGLLNAAGSGATGVLATVGSGRGAGGCRRRIFEDRRVHQRLAGRREPQPWRRCCLRRWKRIRWPGDRIGRATGSEQQRRERDDVSDTSHDDLLAGTIASVGWAPLACVIS
jgi:hypothetical protein